MGLIQKPEDFGMLVFTVLYYAFTMIRLKTNPTTDYNHSGPDIIGFRAKGQELLGGPQSRDRGFCASLWRGGLASYLLPVAQAQTLNPKPVYVFRMVYSHQYRGRPLGHFIFTLIHPKRILSCFPVFLKGFNGPT